VSNVTLCARAVAAAGRYNASHRTLETQNNNARSMDVNQGESSVPGREPEERRHSDRRTHVLRALMYGSLHPRRRSPRRAGERTMTAVDWHHPRWLAIAMLIVLCSSADAFLTLVLIEHGAYEVNPVMAPLVGGSPLAFALVKVGLTALGVVLLTQLARLRAFGNVPVSLFLYMVLAIYAALVLYELQMLNGV
jgi:hypothetical protein